MGARQFLFLVHRSDFWVKAAILPRQKGIAALPGTGPTYHRLWLYSKPAQKSCNLVTIMVFGISEEFTHLVISK